MGCVTQFYVLPEIYIMSPLLTPIPLKRKNKQALPQSPPSCPSALLCWPLPTCALVPAPCGNVDALPALGLWSALPVRSPLPRTHSPDYSLPPQPRPAWVFSPAVGCGLLTTTLGHAGAAGQPILPSYHHLPMLGPLRGSQLLALT